MEASRTMIPVTQAFLPAIEEYTAILQASWDRKWITNRAPLLLELEEKLKQYLSVNHLTITTNGTLPLQIAIKALGVTGEVITTPFSYVATTCAIAWEQCTPVFADIHPEYLTIDETKIEAAITPKTTAILATHVFGNPCNVEAIESIAKKRNLKVIYDAAHCFGVNYKGQSVFNYGDVSTCSFHATKLFHTGEGGAMFCNDEALHQKLFYHHNFGHNGPHDFYGVGTNAKTTELQAAMGLLILSYMEHIFAERKKICDQYDELLQNIPLQKLTLRKGTEWNYSYYPVIFDSEETLLKIQGELNKQNIFPRRYFYPSLNRINYAGNQVMEISESIAKRVLCLPLYVGLGEAEVKQISHIITSNFS